MTISLFFDFLQVHHISGRKKYAGFLKNLAFLYKMRQPNRLPNSILDTPAPVDNHLESTSYEGTCHPN
jgi:hypothetical protein